MIPLASINGHQWLVEEKKKIPLPDYMLRRFPPHRRQELQAVSSDSESSDSDQPLDIPEKASVKFAVHDGKPGLQVRTRITSNWTPITKLNSSYTHSRMHACVSLQLLMSSFVWYICTRIIKIVLQAKLICQLRCIRSQQSSTIYGCFGIPMHICTHTHTRNTHTN